MMKLVIAIAGLLIGSALGTAMGAETYYRSLSACAAEIIGTVYCAPAFGGALQDSIGVVQCGPGQCARDSIGNVHCSSTPGGGAEVNTIGNVYCTDGCTLGSTGYCQRGKL